MPKRLNLTSSLDKEISKFDIIQTITFDNGEYLNVHPFFDQEKLKNMYQEIIDFLNDLQKLKIDFPGELSLHLINFFLIKTFTNIPVPRKSENLLAGFMKLIRTKYYKQIIDEFDEESMVDVYKTFIKILQQTMKYDEDKEKIKEELLHKIENDEVKKMLLENTSGPLNVLSNEKANETIKEFENASKES